MTEPTANRTPCDNCDSSGRSGSLTCEKCDGRGSYPAGTAARVEARFARRQRANREWASAGAARIVDGDEASDEEEDGAF